MKKERIIYVLFFALVLVTTVGILLPKPDNFKLEYDRFWIKKAHAKPIYDLVFIGDSRLYRGISPKIIEHYLPNQKILNFGFSSGGLNPFMYEQAEKKLNPTGKNKIIVLAISPFSLTPEADKNEHFLEQKNTPREEYIEKIYFAPALNFFSPIKTDVFFNDSLPVENYQQTFYNDGWVASYKMEEDTCEALNVYTDIFNENRVSNIQIENLYKQTELWKNRGILVFAFRTPVSMSMKSLEDSLSGFNQKQFISDFEKAGGKWIDTDGKDFHSYDGSHLHKDSAVKLSQLIGEQISLNLF